MSDEEIDLEYSDIEQKSHDLVDAMTSLNMSECKMRILKDLGFGGHKTYTITIVEDE